MKMIRKQNLEVKDQKDIKFVTTAKRTDFINLTSEAHHFVANKILFGAKDVGEKDSKPILTKKIIICK